MLLKLCRSELCAITVEQDVAEMQVFSATVGWLGPNGSKPGHDGSKLGQTWVKCVSCGSPGSC